MAKAAVERFATELLPLLRRREDLEIFFGAQPAERGTYNVKLILSAAIPAATPRRRPPPPPSSAASDRGSGESEGGAEAAIMKKRGAATEEAVVEETGSCSGEADLDA